MAKIFNNSGLVRGSIGNTTYRVSKGRNSAYQKTHPTDARTKRQAKTRYKICNIAHFFSALIGLLKNAFEGKDCGQTDHNMFLKNNTGIDAPNVYLTKQEKNAGFCIAAPYMITKGSLNPVGVTFVDGCYVSGIRLGSLEITADTTVAEFSSTVIDNGGYKNFLNEDKILFCEFLQQTEGSVLKVKPIVNALSLNTEDERPLWNVVAKEAFQSVNGRLGSLPGLPEGAYAWVHTRETPDCNNLVSTERLCCNNSVLAEYTSEQAFERAAKSYGGYTDLIITGDGESLSTGSALDEPTGNVTITAQVATGQTTMGNVQIDDGTPGASVQKTVASGTEVTVKANAQTGYQFTEWTDGNLQATRMVIALIDKTFTAQFEAAASTHTLTLTAGTGGSVAPAGETEHADGESVQITATPNSGWEFLKWSDGNMQNPRTIVMDEDKVLQAQFQEE